MNRTEALRFISSIDGWLSSHEGFFLYEAARKALGKGEIVEIGSWMGKSTICLAAGSQEAGNAKVTAIDPHKGEFSKGNGIGKKAPTFKKFQQNLLKASVKNWVTPVVATSEKVAKKWEKPVQLLFIDGLHDYKSTLRDFSLWSSFIREKGVIAFHDAFCGHIGPEKVVEEKILFNNNWSSIGVVGSIIFAQKGKSKNILQNLNVLRHRLLIPVTTKINKSKLPEWMKFFLIHRVIKLLLLNRYTLLLQLEK